MKQKTQNALRTREGTFRGAINGGRCGKLRRAASHLGPQSTWVTKSSSSSLLLTLFAVQLFSLLLPLAELLIINVVPHSTHSRCRHGCSPYHGCSPRLLLLLMPARVLSHFLFFDLRSRGGVDCVCVFSSHLFWTSSSLDVAAGVTQEGDHTGFFIHLPSAVRALIFLARRIQPFLSLVEREVEFCVLTI